MKVITAIGDEFLNEKLSQLHNYEVVGKDIPYIDGILEILEMVNDIDLIILSNNISETEEFKKLIEKVIKLKNKEIIIFLKETDEYLESYLNSKNIFKIYYLDNNGYDLFLENIENKNNVEEEIKTLKELLINNQEDIKIDKSTYIEDVIEDSKKTDNDCQTIAICGTRGSGKTIVSKILVDFIKRKNKKVYLLNFRKNKFNNYSFENMYDIKRYLEDLKKKYEILVIDVIYELKEIKTILCSSNKIIFLIEPNISEIEKGRSILDWYINDFEISVDKIKILFNKTNKYKLAECFLEEIFEEFEIIGNLKYDEKYSLIINKNKIENYLDKEYEKIYQAI